MSITKAAPLADYPEEAYAIPTAPIMQEPIYHVSPQAPQQTVMDPRLAARGLKSGGEYKTEKYVGPLTLVVAIFISPCICMCPLDEREVYEEPGTKRTVVLSKN
mmetsp:Transcript_11783/g.21499  ORF Transcript_11783/g.21499 Transcript_11783/m.21499 type:complete len:104 (-) Transcript_11783:1492-1803(-)